MWAAIQCGAFQEPLFIEPGAVEAEPERLPVCRWPFKSRKPTLANAVALGTFGSWLLIPFCVKFMENRVKMLSQVTGARYLLSSVLSF